MRITLNIKENKAITFINFIKSLDFIKIEKEEIYNPEFVAKIKESEKQHKEGKFTRVNVDELDSFLGLK